jgi:hypothetical protein
MRRKTPAAVQLPCPAVLEEFWRILLQLILAVRRKEHEKRAIRLSSLMRRLIPRRPGIPHDRTVTQKVREKILREQEE